MSNAQTVFKGRLLTVRVRDARLPNGTRTRIEWIDHPGAVLIVPFVSRSRIILLRQYRPALQAWMYELPAGTLEPGERPITCARRELVEETGYRAAKLTRLGVIYPVPGYSTEKITLYTAEQLTMVESACEADEVIETITTTRSEVRALAHTGRLVDAKTICALSLCGWL